MTLGRISGLFGVKNDQLIYAHCCAAGQSFNNVGTFRKTVATLIDQEVDTKSASAQLGHSSEDADKIADLFHQKYRGSRYSFGYPACPNLEDRRAIVQLLKPDDIGVQLTENHMLVPEQSTDALVAHHPQAKYFDV